MKPIFLVSTMMAGIWCGSLAPAHAQLVIKGETISDARTTEAARKEGKLLLYTTYPNDPMKVIITGFQDDTGINVEFVRLPTQDMFQRTLSEAAAGKLPADYIDLTDLTLVEQLVDKKILAVPHKVPSFDEIPDRIKDPEGRWYGVIRPISIMAVNTARMKSQDIPKSWKDVLDPKWRGQAGIAGMDAGGSAFTLFSFLTSQVDPAFITKLGGLSPHVYPSVAPLATDLARGEIAIGLGAISEQMIAQARAGAPVKVVFPLEGVSAFPASGGITATAQHPNAAALFLDWLTSKRGGTVIASAGAYPANVDAPVPTAEGLIYPPPDKLWNLDAKVWTETRDVNSNKWRADLGTQ
jgi:iron(III) transport system substrate-binding protein